VAAAAEADGAPPPPTADPVAPVAPPPALDADAMLADAAAAAAPAVSPPGDGLAGLRTLAAALAPDKGVVAQAAAAADPAAAAGVELLAPFTEGDADEEPGYAPLDFGAAPTPGAPPADPFADRPPPPPTNPDDGPDLGTYWGLGVLALAYVHHSTCGFALPALLPLVAPDLGLTDSQGAALTAGYTLLYAVALVPVGVLADRADRPRLLAAGAALWSMATLAASRAHSFGELLALRTAFAAAQATQNPVCFSLIPELFPRGRNTAMAAYNAAIYVGRALSFAAVIVAGRMGAVPEGVAGGGGGPGGVPLGVTLVPLDKLDLSQVSLLYTQGNMAAITPIYDYNFSVLHSVVTEGAWRQLLFWLGPPGLVVAALALLTLGDPRSARSAAGDPFASSRFTAPAVRALSRGRGDSFGGGGGAAAAATTAATTLAPGAPAAAALASTAPPILAPATPPPLAAGAVPPAKPPLASMVPAIKALAASRSFQAITAAAAINDVGSWALVAWQATFYARVFGLEPETYAPALAIILPLGGIAGGVGGGLLADGLSRSGGRYLLTAGATVLAAPVLAASVLAPDAPSSFAALLLGFGLSEMWRAPAAVMVRDVSPPELGSTGSALHLCARNVLGGAGPLLVAVLSERVGLQTALLLVPVCFATSGVAFFFAERVLAEEKARTAAESAVVAVAADAGGGAPR